VVEEVDEWSGEVGPVAGTEDARKEAARVSEEAGMGGEADVGWVGDGWERRRLGGTTWRERRSRRRSKTGMVVVVVSGLGEEAVGEGREGTDGKEEMEEIRVPVSA
jgi:hypothetical protein